MFSQIDKKVRQFFFTKTHQQAFLEDVSALIKDGVPAQQAIATIYEVSTGTTKEVAKAILDNIATGQRISDSMHEWFAPIVIEIIRTGEEGGTLLKSFHSAINSLIQRGGAFTAFLASTLYPLVVFVMAIFLSVFLKHSVFENFATIKPVAEWPQDGRTVYMMANFIETWWVLIMVFIIGLVFFIRGLLTGLTGELRYVIDKLPILSIYRNYTAARYMETLGLLLTNGVPLKQALNLLQKNASKYLAWHIYLMQFRLSGGRENIADVLDTSLISSEDIFRLRVMAKGKGFDQALLSLGAQSLERTAKKVKNTGRLLGGILLIVDALFAIFMIFAVYGVGSSVGGM